MTKKFELESEEEKKKITESYSASIENLMSEKEVGQGALGCTCGPGTVTVPP